MKILQTSQFKKDFKKLIKRGKEKEKLFSFLEILAAGGDIPAAFNDHPLKGNWKGRRDCHIEPDWILIYQISDTELILERTGSHSDLF